jgi:hypothetical protein
MVDRYTFLIISRPVLLRMKNVSDKRCRETWKTRFTFSNFFFILPFMRQCGKLLKSGADHRWQYGACALHAGYLSLQTHTHTQNMQYYLIFHHNNGCMNASHCYVILHCLYSWNLKFTDRWIFQRAKSAGLLPVDLATNTNDNYKNSHLWRPMSDKGTVLPRDRIFRIEDSTPPFLTPSTRFRNCVAVRSVHSNCKHLYTVLDILHPVLQYFNPK